MKDNKLFVTGSNGFLGSEIVRLCLKDKIPVRGIGLQNTSRYPGVDYYSGDILKDNGLKEVMKGITTVIHAAGLAHVFHNSRHAPFKEVNEIGTLRVATAAAEARVRCFVLVSSVSVYGEYGHNENEMAPCLPVGNYANSKLASERRAMEVARNSGMDLVILRLATLYGESDPGNVARLMRSIDKKRFIWIGQGANYKSLLHREDAARACLAAAFPGTKGINIYNVSGPPSLMWDVVTGLASALGRRVPAWQLPSSWALGLAGFASGLVKGNGRFGSLPGTIKKWLADDTYDTTKFDLTFNFKPRVALAEGLRREVEWYCAQENKLKRSLGRERLPYPAYGPVTSRVATGLAREFQK